MNSRQICCSFCGASREEVEEMIISSDESAAICDGCVGIAVIAIEESQESMPSTMLH